MSHECGGITPLWLETLSKMHDSRDAGGSGWAPAAVVTWNVNGKLNGYLYCGVAHVRTVPTAICECRRRIFAVGVDQCWKCIASGKRSAVSLDELLAACCADIEANRPPVAVEAVNSAPRLPSEREILTAKGYRVAEEMRTVWDQLLSGQAVDTNRASSRSPSPSAAVKCVPPRSQSARRAEEEAEWAAHLEKTYLAAKNYRPAEGAAPARWDDIAVDSDPKPTQSVSWSRPTVVSTSSPVWTPDYSRMRVVQDGPEEARRAPYGLVFDRTARAWTSVPPGGCCRAGPTVAAADGWRPRAKSPTLRAAEADAHDDRDTTPTSPKEADAKAVESFRLKLSAWGEPAVSAMTLADARAARVRDRIAALRETHGKK
jgi:hypothetical protein